MSRAATFDCGPASASCRTCGGAEAVIGGGAQYDVGFFVEPDRVLPDMRIAQEVFGPVLSRHDEGEPRRSGLVMLAARSVRPIGPGGMIGALSGGYRHSGFGRSTGPRSSTSLAAPCPSWAAVLAGARVAIGTHRLRVHRARITSVRARCGRVKRSS